MTFNIIASTFRYREEDALDELQDILSKLGDQKSECEKSDVSGIILGYTHLDIYEVVRKLKSLVAAEPWQIHYLLRLLPVDAVVSTDLESIQKTAAILASKIGFNETFRITVEKRHSIFSTSQIIMPVANQIRNKVNLENPDWIVLIEVVGKYTGISVLRPEQIFSSVVEKRQLSTL
jgi:tRNA acetyltransferase TAN1